MRGAAPTLLFLMTACGDVGADGNRAASNMAGSAASELREAAATLSLSATGPGGCTARWDGQPATPQQVLDRSAALVERAIQTAGGITNLTEDNTPTVALVAPGNLGFACADTYLAAIRRSGVPAVLLLTEGGGEPALADFTLSDIGAPPPMVALAVERGGQVTWNGERIGMDSVAQRLREAGAGTTEIEAPPGEFELRPARDASFGQVHQVLRALRDDRVRVALLLPSVEPSRPPPPRAPAEAAPPAGNEAAAAQ